MKPSKLLLLILVLAAVMLAFIEYGDKHFIMKSRTQSSLER